MKFQVKLEHGDDSLLVPIETEFKGSPAGTFGALLYGKDERMKQFIVNALEYAYQTSIGRAIVSTVVKHDKKINVWFFAKGAYDPENIAVKWNPFAFAWFMDTAKHWQNRSRNIGKSFDGDLIVRPSDSEYQYSQDGATYVIGMNSPATVFLHELGHRIQHIRRPQYFTERFRLHAADFEHLVKEGAEAKDDFVVADTYKPWETDNVNWNETPFVKQLRALGVCEGIRWHYCDDVGTFQVDTWELETTGQGVKVIRFKTDGEDGWKKTQCFFKCMSPGTSTPTKVYNGEYESAQKAVSSAMNTSGLFGTTYFPKQDMLEKFFRDNKI